MILDDFVATTYLLATGKAVPPTFGQSKYTKMVALANLYTAAWANEAETDWQSLRQIFVVSSTVTPTATFSQPDGIGKISDQDGDYVRIMHTDGTTESDYTVVPVQRLYDGRTSINNTGEHEVMADGTVAIAAGNLIFSRAFLATDPQIGGTIKIPGYIIPDKLINPTDLISTDDPYYLCYRVAAEYIRNDITRVQLYGSLIDQAKESMAGMQDKNATQSEETYRGAWTPLGITWY